MPANGGWDLTRRLKVNWIALTDQFPSGSAKSQVPCCISIVGLLPISTDHHHTADRCVSYTRNCKKKKKTKQKQKPPLGFEKCQGRKNWFSQKWRQCTMPEFSAPPPVLVSATNVSVWINQSYFKAPSHPWHNHDSKKLRQTSTSEMEGATRERRRYEMS